MVEGVLVVLTILLLVMGGSAIVLWRRSRHAAGTVTRASPADPARREFLRAGAATVGGLALAAVTSRVAAAAPHHARAPQRPYAPTMHGGNMAVGDVDVRRLGFDPVRYLTQFDMGKVTRLPNGRTQREYTIVASEREIEIAPGVFFPAWVFGPQGRPGSVPGPTIRCREGDLLRIRLINASTQPHTLHFHGFHTAEMDGVPGIGRGDIMPGESFTYEFDASPFGLHLYHCHTAPLKRHIHKGLYGTFIIDPRQGRPPARELVMMMNAFDTTFDDENEVYAVNTVAFHYAKHPIRVKRGELVRIYLVNITEFDPVNSLHIHGNFFQVYRTGTSLRPSEFTDTIMLCQAERAILELRFPHPGRFMFHAHQTEFTELGWMGLFEVTDNGV
jgi:FtsP/CotA-like multicopper oxidase with cupredoxin domain